MLSPSMLAAAPQPVLSAPTTARIGHAVRVAATHVLASRYTLTIVSDTQPAHNARCLANVGRSRMSSDGRVVLHGTIPRTLTCYQGSTVRLGTVKTAAGA